VYRYRGEGGRQVVAAKGIPDPVWEELEAGEPVRWSSMAGLRRARDGRFFERVEQSRRVTGNTGGRLPDGKVLTKPPRVNEP
jgi:hypothetical protein